MTVGTQPTQAGVNQNLTALAVQTRDLMTRIRQYQGQLVQLGASGLEGLGFSPADAATAITDIDYMATIAGCYFGTVQQGGNGGTGAVAFDFDNALNTLWGDS